jgi:hypothetical protein
MSVTDCVNMLQNNAADLDLFFTLQRTAQEEIGINFFKPLRNTEYGLERLSRQKRKK